MTAPPVDVEVVQDPLTLQSQPIPTAHVNLLPVEIIVRRHVRAIQRRFVVVLALVIVGCLAANGWYRLEDSLASSALTSQLGTVDVLRKAQLNYSEVPRNDSERAAIDETLAQVMANDVRWDVQLAALVADTNGGVTLTAVKANSVDVTSGAVVVESGAAPGVLDSSGVEHVGVLTVTGTAATHAAVSDWVAALAGVDGFLVPYIRGTAIREGTAGGVDFTVEITLGASVRTLRYVDSSMQSSTTEAGGG